MTMTMTVNRTMKIIKDLYFSLKEVISRLICIKNDWENVINHRSSLEKFFVRKIVIIFYPSVLTSVVGAQKNRLNEMVLLSTHNICFISEIRKISFQ